MEQEEGEGEDIQTALQDLPPSAKLVVKVLEYEGELTQAELVEETYLVPRTVRYALSELEREGLVESDVYFADARKDLYGLAPQLRRTPVKKEISD